MLSEREDIGDDSFFLIFFGVTFPAGAVAPELADFPSLPEATGLKLSGFTVLFPWPESVFLMLVAVPLLPPRRESGLTWVKRED